MKYTNKTIEKLVTKQRSYFNTGSTLDIDFRIEALKKLRTAVINNEEAISKALNEDLGRHNNEAYLCDIGPTIMEINETIKGLRKWARPEFHFSGLLCFPSIYTRVYKMPYGVTLLISPFNFPILLSLGVLAASIAAGNTAIIKPSSKSKECTSVLKKIISETFNEEYITVVDGGHDVADMLLEQRFDKIFYTGSPKVAKHVMEMASKNLTPVALELGGETGNWAIVRKDADIKDAARKIAFFKSLNSGQICINVNQVAVEEEIADKFIRALEDEFIAQVEACPFDNDEYPCLIDKAKYLQVEKEAQKYQKRIIFGGKGDPNKLKYSPTIIFPVKIDEDIVNHELFSPLLPIVKFKDVDKLLQTIQKREHPLALYLFTKNIKWANKTMKTMQYGGGCINEVCIHMMVKGVPFNGTGHSGMGAYHGEWGFKEFSHPQTVLKGNTKFNLSLRQHPYTNLKLKLMKLFER